MAAHTKEQFDLFMSQLWETNSPLSFYCDFPKIRQNVRDIEISLTTLNYLIGKEDLRGAVEAYVGQSLTDILNEETSYKPW